MAVDVLDASVLCEPPCDAASNGGSQNLFLFFGAPFIFLPSANNARDIKLVRGTENKMGF